MRTGFIPSIRKQLANENGQLFLISLMLLGILGIAVATVVFMHQSGTRASLANQNRSDAVATAQEGLAYATHVLATSTTTWQNALAGTFPSEFQDITGPHVYSDSGGGVFTIQCSVGGTLQSFEVQVLVQAGALNPGTGQPAYTKALQAALSKKTLSVGLPTEVHAGAALVIAGSYPNLKHANNLQVDWGPMVSYDTATWTLQGNMDSLRFPRKYSLGAITGTSFLRSLDLANPNNTDQLEYWANTSLGYPGTLDLASYQALAQNTFGVVGATCSVSANCAASPSGTGYFPAVGTDTALFQGGWTVPASSAVIYINGNADLEDVAIDLKNTGAFIVNGNLTLGNPLNQTIASTVVRVPNTASADYAYNLTTCPCYTQQGQTCSISQATGGATPYLPFRGFLYVTGNLIIPTNNSWVLNGVVRVDGQIQAPKNGTLEILYDDEINRSILVTPIELMIDSQSIVTVS